LQMSDKPAYNRGVATASRPYSLSNDKTAIDKKF
jgi:hypothetical protein